ncbi:MAG: rhodanese-like domain-containing protein, partial [Desulfopila sp.]|nr:rhodanese-like domain-containing protein [Desulfopila sp.]
MAKVTMISPQEAFALAESEKGRLIDVRTVGEALAEQLPGSLFLPFDLVNRQRLEEMGVIGEVPILVCRSGSRAKQAAEALAAEMGEVAVLDGGIVRWKEDGLETDTGSRAIPLERQVLVGAGSMMLLFTILGFLVSPFFYAL